MCGFAGELAVGRAADRDAVERMAATMSDRGPDGQGSWAHDAVALRALAKGSVEFTLAYDAVFNEPGSPWFKMFEESVYSGNVAQGVAQGQPGIQSSLDSVKG